MTHCSQHTLGALATGSFGALVVVLFLATGCGENQTPPADGDPYAPGDVDELACRPALDGQIDADQLQPALGVPISYRVSPAAEERPIDLAGFVDAQGERVWDFSQDHRSDQQLEVEATALAEQWYAEHYEGADFSTVLDPDLRLDAVYSHDGQDFFLHGYASQQEDTSLGKTLVVYQEPVPVYRLPLREGDTWGGTGVVQDGMVRGLPYTGQETYAFRVDATGALWLPDIRFEKVLRIRTELTVDTPLGEPIYRQQVQFLFECFGEVMRLVGPDLELADGVSTDDYVFDRTVEMRRFGFGF